MNTVELTQKLVLWIREKVLAAGCEGTVLGMSGGIDSSVLAILCQRAFPQSTLGVIMPCFSSEEDKAHARLVTNKFGIPTTEVVLDNIFTALLQSIPELKASSELNRLAQANLKSRLRMVILYYIANQFRYLVAGSSNRSEIAVGYFTKHGDGGVDIMPLGSLVKRQIQELAAYLGVPQPIIDKSPTAGLWPGQTDEGEMGFAYEELDGYLLTGKALAEVKRKIESMMAASAHKRAMPPIAKFQVGKQPSPRGRL